VPYKIKLRSKLFITDADPDDYQGPDLPALQVDDLGDIDTGLVDSDGNPIMRSPEKIGFH
jgi:hypothetical protein